MHNLCSLKATDQAIGTSVLCSPIFSFETRESVVFNPYFNINTLSLNQKGYYYENEKNIQEILHR